MRLVVLAATVLVALSVACQQQPPPEVYGRMPEFSLTDQRGQAFDSTALAGKVALVDFVYTHCTDACPLLSATFQQAQSKLADERLLGSKVQLLSVSVDPEHDTPSVLAEYGQRFKADPAAWTFATGDWDAVYDVLTGLKLSTRPPRPPGGAPAPGGTELSHTTRVVLVDAQGQVRGYLDGLDATADDLVGAVKRVLR